MNRISFYIIISGLSILLCFNSSNIFAYTKVIVKDSNYNSVPLMIAKFASDYKSKNIANSINTIITYDLVNCGMFSVYNHNVPKKLNYLSKLSQTNQMLSSYIDFNAVIFGKVRYDASNGHELIEYIVWDTFNNKAIASGGISLINPSKEDVRYIAHYISEAAYKSIIGDPGYFNSKIAFVSNKRLYLMDYDGYNKHAITPPSTSDIFTPSFSPNNLYISYVKLVKGRSKIYIYDFIKNKSYKLGNFSSMVMSPRFSKNSNKLLFAVSHSGSTNIFSLNIKDKKIKEITYSSSINIPGSYSPNGKKIVFTSDRINDKPQIYVSSSNGSNAIRISDLSENYYSPKWSPRGDLITFTKIVNKKFVIGIMNNKGGDEQIISTDAFSQQPYWAPGGRSLIYQFKYDFRNNWHAFYLINIANGYKLLIKPFEDAQDPVISSKILNNKILESIYKLP